MAEPPAKKARLHEDTSGNEALILDAPGSPVDDFEDDFYETTPANPAASAADDGGLPSSSTLSAEPAKAVPSQLPGLGLWGEPSAHQTTVQNAPATAAEAAEEGEVEFEFSDHEDQAEDSFYDESKPPVTAPPADLEGALQQNDNDAAAPAVPNEAPPASPERQGSPAQTHDDVQARPAASPTHKLEDGDSTVKPEEDGKTEFLQAAEANKDNKEAEWQADSEASDSSSDSSSDDSSSDEDSDSDGELLSPEEAIKRMMAAESGDEKEPAADQAKNVKVKTQNEVDEEYKKPDIPMTDTTPLSLLGEVESIVDNVVVIKAYVSAKTYVVAPGSALCLTDRTVIGQISEAIGRVNEPRYSVGFADPEEIATLGIKEHVQIWFVNEYSSFIDTEPMRHEKYTDASGIYDEEAKGVEFSDDEKERKHKLNLKQRKRIANQGSVHAEGRRGSSDSHYEAAPSVPDYLQDLHRFRPPADSTHQSSALKYSDDEDEDLGMYKPLARPDRFEELVGRGAPIEDRSHVRRGMMRGGRGWPDRGRGRGFRGRGGMGGNSGRDDRGEMSGYAGRGDRGGMSGFGTRGDRGDRRGMGGRGDRDDRGGRSFRGQRERFPRPQEQQPQRSGPPQEPYNNRRAAFSPAGSPPRQNQGQHQGQFQGQNRGQHQNQGPNPGQHQAQQSPQQSKKKKKKKNRNRRESPSRSAQPPAAPNANTNVNTNAYASNNAQSSGGWNPNYAASTGTGYAATTAVAPATAPQAYSSPVPYPQQPQAATQAQAAQLNMAQWLQLAAAITQAQGQQPPAQQPQQYQQPPQPQPQVQYQYPYQYQQTAAPPPDPRLANRQPAGNTQQVGSSLQDILRALGNGSGA